MGIRLMGFRSGVPLCILLATLVLQLFSPGSALNTRHQASQLRGASAGDGGDKEQSVQKDKNSDNEDDDDDDDDDSDDDDKESEEEKAVQKARAEAKKKLVKKASALKAKLDKNLDEQEEINAQIREFDNGDGNTVIHANVKAVDNETDSATMGGYLGDMWKEMRMYATPFYQEHIMEERGLLARKAPALEKKYDAELLKLKKQKLEWAEKDAIENAQDEEDAKDKKAYQKEAKNLKKEVKKVEEEEMELDIWAKPPWMKKEKIIEAPEPAEEKEEKEEEPGFKPEWMQALEAQGITTEVTPAKKQKADKAEVKKPKKEEVKEDDKKKDEEDDEEEPNKEAKKAKKAKKAKEEDEEDDDEEDEEEPKKKAKKAKKDKAKEEDEEEDDEEEAPEKKAAPLKVSEKDDDGLVIGGKLPWMKDKEARQAKRKQQPKPVKKTKKPAEDNTVKPDWMKSLEDKDDEDSDDEKKTEEKTEPKKKKEAKEGDEEDDEDEEETPADKKDKSADKDDEEEGAEAPVLPRGQYKAKFTEKTMPSLSPTVKCVIFLAWQFFIVYTAMAVLRTVNQITQNRFASCVRAQELVGMVMPYVMFAPMLSVLFLATRMRAIQLSQGNTEKHGLPQWWVQYAMYMATYGVMLQVIFKLGTFMMSYRVLPDGSAVAANVESRLAVFICAICKFVFMACIYVGFTTVCVGAIIMQGPEELWDGNQPKVSASLWCTMALTITFFAIYLGLCLFRTVEDIKPRVFDEVNLLVKVQLLFWRARHAVNLAPMLCVLFIVARMRALQMDPKNGNPLWYAQAGMYCCSCAMIIQVVASIALPLIDRNAYIKPGPVQGQIVLVMSMRSLSIIGDLIRYIPLLCIYGGAGAIVAGVFLQKAPAGQTTPEISATMRCVIGLTSLYFGVFTAVYLAQTFMDHLPDATRAKRAVTVLDAGQRTVMLAPMLCILFIAARMRALQLTRTVDGKIPPSAGPQKWVQDGMYFATGAVFMQVLMAYLGTAFLGPGFTPSEDAQKEDPHEPKSTSQEQETKSPAGDKRVITPGWAVGVALKVVEFICLFGLYGGLVTVMVGTVIMTPETLPPYHKSPGVVESALKTMF